MGGFWPVESQFARRVFPSVLSPLIERLWSAPASMCSVAWGRCLVNSLLCARGTSVSWSPCRISVGAGMFGACVVSRCCCESS